MGASNYLENKIFEHVYRGVTYTSPALVYASLYTNNPGEANTGTEVTGGSYARQIVTFTAPTDGVGNNTTAVVFPTATAAWGTVTHYALHDAPSGGNMLSYAPLASSQVVNSGQVVVFTIGSIIEGVQ
jgi:hypothetical protein